MVQYITGKWRGYTGERPKIRKWYKTSILTVEILGLGTTERDRNKKTLELSRNGLCQPVCYCRFPVPVDLKKTNLKKEIDNVLQCCLLSLGHGPCRYT